MNPEAHSKSATAWLRAAKKSKTKRNGLTKREQRLYRYALYKLDRKGWTPTADYDARR